MNKALTPEARKLLEKLEKSGELTPEKVIEVARDSASPLHEFFEWNTDKAALQYLIIQARQVIRSVKIEVTIRERTISAPKYVKDPDRENNAGYVNVLSIKGDEDRAREVLEDELNRVLAMLHRAQKVAAALDMEDELEQLIGQATKVRDDLLAEAAE